MAQARPSIVKPDAIYSLCSTSTPHVRGDSVEETKGTVDPAILYSLCMPLIEGDCSVLYSVPRCKSWT